MKSNQNPKKLAANMITQNHHFSKCLDFPKFYRKQKQLLFVSADTSKSLKTKVGEFKIWGKPTYPKEIRSGIQMSKITKTDEETNKNSK